MAELIYRTEPGPFQAEYPAWRIERQPGSITDPMVVQFVKCSAVRKLLDQNARWAGDGWDPQRWVPRVPIVPKTILDLVEQHMLGVA